MTELRLCFPILTMIKPFLGNVQSGQNNNSLFADNAIPVKYMEDFWEGYKMLRIIGQGGGGIVFKAIHTHLNKDVVIKKRINSNAVKDDGQNSNQKTTIGSYIAHVIKFLKLPL